MKFFAPIALIAVVNGVALETEGGYGGYGLKAMNHCTGRGMYGCASAPRHLGVALAPNAGRDYRLGRIGGRSLPHSSLGAPLRKGLAYDSGYGYGSGYGKW